MEETTLSLIHGALSHTQTLIKVMMIWSLKRLLRISEMLLIKTMIFKWILILLVTFTVLSMMCMEALRTGLMVEAGMSNTCSNNALIINEKINTKMRV